METSPDKLKAFLGGMEKDLSKAWLGSPRDFSAFLISLDYEKCRIICEAMKDSLKDLIESVYDFVRVLRYLSLKQCTAVCEAMKDPLKDLIKSADDFVRVLHPLSPEQRAAVYEVMQGALLKAMQSDPKCYHKIKRLSPEQQVIIFDAVKDNKGVMLAVVKQDGRALQYASEVLRGDREVVLAAVKQDGRALEYASEVLRGDVQLKVAAYIPCFALALQHPQASQSILLGLAIAVVAMKYGLSFLPSVAIGASVGALAGSTLFKHTLSSIRNNTNDDDDAQELDLNSEGPAALD